MKRLFFVIGFWAIFSCHKDDTDSIAAPKAKIVVQATDGKAPEEVVFINESENADNYIWSFGDGTFSEEVSPSHYYGDAGNYTVQLTAIGKGGKDSTELSFSLAPSDATYYNVKNASSTTLGNVRSFYLDWDASLVYDIVEHGDMVIGQVSHDIETEWPSIEVLFKYNDYYFQLAFPDSIIEKEVTTISIYDTSSCYKYDSDPISTSSMVKDANRKLIRIEELKK